MKMDIGRAGNIILMQFIISAIVEELLKQKLEKKHEDGYRACWKHDYYVFHDLSDRSRGQRQVI